MRIIALDVHRSFAQTAILENGKLRDAGKVDLERNRLLQFARKLKLDDEIVIEATGNTSSIVRLLSPFVGRVVVANSILVRALIRCRSRVKGGGSFQKRQRACTGPIERFGHVVAHPILGGLNHRYARI